MQLVQVLILLNLCFVAWSYRILVICAYPAKSHCKIFETISLGLMEKQHDVTFLSYFPIDEPSRNYTSVDLRQPGHSYLNYLNLKMYTGSKFQNWFNLRLIQEAAMRICEKDFASEQVRKFLKQSHSFDVIVAPVVNSDCYLSLMYKFGAPVVGVSTVSIVEWVSGKFGLPSNPAYIPNTISDLVNPMTFLGRTDNFLMGFIQRLCHEILMVSYGEKTAKEYFGGRLPSLRELVHNVSVLLVNNHFNYHVPRPLVPAVMEIGGMHIRKIRELAQDLEKWINESTHGVIYFSLGSMIKGHTFPDEKRQEFLKAFGRLPQRVLWKYENDTMPGKPDNVMIQKWMPQLDILCHPNVKAFISHGGLLGTTEAVHCGVPVMVMPQYGDQFTNAKALEANGGGVILHLYEATEEKVYDALKTILDPKFKKQAEELSTRFRDRPMPPLETAIYWVEYVARHRGAHHMRTAAVGMPLYKYLLLDVIAFLLLVFGLVFAASFYVTRAIFRKLFGKKDKQKGD
ncbi:UDP-glycosyltransferase UGT5-like isoform X10 [Zophobas morio]|uniref:UDP-glycosyltransferase UGT5-like isoform X10 n=1 Tax=Zophobas morio TaxID=2755281 RepID=UPI003082C2BC